MTRIARLRRCCLSVPGDSDKMLDKSQTMDCDQLILDLEDSVAYESKAKARDKVSKAIKGKSFFAKTVSVRINATDTEHCHSDLIELVSRAGEKLDTVILSKTRRPADVLFVDMLLSQLENKHGLTKKIGIECLIEDVEGLMRVEEIASSTDRTEALIFGMGDFAASQGMRIQTIGGGNNQANDIWHYPRYKITIAAKAFGLDAIDGPYADFNDTEHLKSDCDRVSLIGMNGKWAIHPNQIEVIQTIFSYSEEEVKNAKAQLAAYEEGKKNGLGVVKLGNTMIDAASVKLVETVLEKAKLMDL